MVHATLPAPTYNVQNGGPSPRCSRSPTTNASSTAACRRGSTTAPSWRRWPTHRRDAPIGGFARQWLADVHPVVPPHVAAVDRGGSATQCLDAATRLLRAGAPLRVRAQPVGPASTVLSLQLGITDDDGHRHNDVGLVADVAGRTLGVARDHRLLPEHRRRRRRAGGCQRPGRTQHRARQRTRSGARLSGGADRDEAAREPRRLHLRRRRFHAGLPRHPPGD